MNRNADLRSSPSLTEFPREFEEGSETLLTKIVNKFSSAYNTGYNNSNDIKSPATDDNDSANASQSDSAGKVDTASDSISDIENNFESNANANCAVNTPHLSPQSGTPSFPDLRNYKHTELHRFWMPDEKAKECYDCSLKFTSFRRKHHCRLCGQIFCSKCCNQVVPGRIIMCSGDLKVCLYCSKIVLRYLKSSEVKLDLKVDLEAFKDNLSSKLSLNDSSSFGTPEPSLKRKISVGYQEEQFLSNANSNLTNEDRKSILQQSNSLKALHEEMTRSMPGQNCGADFLTFLINARKSSNRVQAIAIINAMLAAGFVIPIVPDTEETEFEETLHYKLAKQSEIIENAERNNIDDNAVGSATQLQHVEENKEDVYPPKSTGCFKASKDMELDHMRSKTKTARELVESYCEHEDMLISQLLKHEDLDQSWANILIPLCAKIVNKFRPHFGANDFMDIRNYVNFKKVQGGVREDCCIMGGVVFTKNVAHKRMAKRIEHPRVLLLQCAIVYERVEGKYISMETLLLQEKEYLRNVVGRILNLKPNVVLVQKGVAGIAQDMLRNHGVTLVLDVKSSVMDRLARCMQCDIVTSIESNISAPKLGTCDLFFIENFQDAGGMTKTLMGFEVYSNPKNYAFLLRGGNNMELAKVKKVASIVLFARYNWRFEMAFLLDIFAKPPTSSYLSKPDMQNATQSVEISPRDNEVPIDSIPCIVNGSNLGDPLSSQINNSPQDDIETNESPILSVSPYIVFPLPWKNFSIQDLSSMFLEGSKIQSLQRLHDTNSVSQTQLKPHHEFVLDKITPAVGNRDFQVALSAFRALGGRYPKSTKMLKSNNIAASTNPRKSSDVAEKHADSNTFDLQSYQRLSVLFCSFYHNPKAASSFCAQPTIFDMKFYGQNDIMLGQFLERYCFRSYICQSCKLPMMDHVRRYVHSMACVQVQLSEDINQTKSDEIFVTSWCNYCREMTPNVPISQDTWCLSFAKYLELRFYGHSYRKRVANISEDDAEIKISEFDKQNCRHSIQKDYVHYFYSKGFGVRFIYSPIEVWDINFPPLKIKLDALPKYDRPQFQEDIKKLSIKGHEIYSKIHNRIVELTAENEPELKTNLTSILNRDQSIFRHCIEVVHTLLAEKSTPPFELNDALVKAKRALVESIDLWGPRLCDPISQTKTSSKLEATPQIEESTICTEDLETSFGNHAAEKQGERDLHTTGEQSTSTQHSKTREISSKNFSEYIMEKINLKQLLNQLLPPNNQNNIIPSPFPIYEHYTLPIGEFPIVIQEQDLSSIIAYSLVSHEYRKITENIHHSTDSLNSPVTKKKSQDGLFEGDTKEEKKSDDDKKSKSRPYIELCFQDSTAQFICKIFFAKEFDALRAKVFNASKKDTEKSDNDAIRILFARSLCKSMQWEARGGKSGLKFSKTLDDRFILKEMSKGDVSLFENFAPNYFEYMNKCLQNEQLTLLAKILGVFKVTVKKKDLVQERSLLVIENLFYDWDIKNKFDLKGSERNRLVNPENNDGEMVLLDENLIKMSWSKPLYIQSKSKTTLCEAINNDSSFLERNSIIDYSLLVGLNNKENILVLGIIDYIRTYTFDKRLESLVKQSGLLGGQGKLPTVIAPQRYKQRFREAMERYFLAVPERWENVDRSKQCNNSPSTNTKL
ncbi:putative 1-phosphatidylinositol 3-phosphate 5-kinase isoform X2 [Hermetia illucens]|uniref:putative 1-phosphatidylinositol 3-phosphate 5-kinase isoform X2 n=1 Tax=Hermetia illucens TaxID=343691 RepID=UPI0018CC3569|nr:putative 1-phosphatidylinositol 3-phosphate 5-kinase isoform X2 [Hermetia illucens]